VRVESTGYIADTIPFSNVDGPGNRFVVFLQGCNFDCAACHNPQTIPGHGGVEGHHPEHRTVHDLLADIRRAAPFISGVTVSGGEATQQPNFLHDLFAAIKRDDELAGLTCMVDSNGGCELEVWDRLAPLMDGAMVDLKNLDDDVHRAMTGQSNRQVLASIEHLQHIGQLYEVRLLLVAGVNDDPEVVRRTGEYLASVDSSMRVKLIGFRRHGARDHDPPLIEPTPDQLESAANVLRAVGSFDLTLI
jgi:pyruvate formate lyase activating enzyme